MSDPNAAKQNEQNTNSASSKQSDKAKSESSPAPNDPVADALQKMVAEQAAKIKELEDKLKPKTDPAPSQDVLKDLMAKVADLAKIATDDLVAKALPNLTADQKKAIEASIKGKSVAETQALLDAFKAVIPPPVPVGGVPVPAGQGAPKSIFDKDRNPYQQVNGKWQYIA